jgi:hypothetical protein
VTDVAEDGVTVSRGVRAAEEVAVSRGLRVTVMTDVGETVRTGVTPVKVTVADAEKDTGTDAVIDALPVAATLTLGVPATAITLAVEVIVAATDELSAIVHPYFVM